MSRGNAIQSCFQIDEILARLRSAALEAHPLGTPADQLRIINECVEAMYNERKNILSPYLSDISDRINNHFAKNIYHRL